MAKKLGFALGAGGSRGIAHIGFLKAMEEEGIKPYCISGSSMGAVVGSCYCAGMTPDEMKEVAFSLKKLDLLDLSSNVLKNQALFKGKKMLGKIEEQLGDKKFEDLNIPYACMAVDLITGKEITLFKDYRVADCVAASASIPGVFKPVELDDMLLVDGGVRNRLPIKAARKLGAECIVTVDVLGSLREEDKPLNLVSVMFRTVDIYDSGVTELKLKKYKPDLLIRPEMGNISQYKFANYDISYQSGYDAGKENADKIRELIAD